jgi:multiple antibiotic resistance protein
MSKSELITFTTAMFAMLNPIGGVAIFAGMAAGRSDAEHRSIAIRCAIAVAIILAATVWAGEFVLKLFDVGVANLQTAGGLIVAMIGVSMLHSKQSAIHDTGSDTAAADKAQDIAVVPLAMPVMAGPGAIVTVIVNTHQHSGIESSIEITVVCLALSVLVGVCFLAAGRIASLLGAKGLDILTKFMGLILVAIAAGMFATGLKGLLPGLA